MSIEACIAHAIQRDLDILEALPEIQQLPVEQLENYIERYVTEIQESLYVIIDEVGEPYLRSRDAAGLCATCLEAGLELPPKVLLKMCQTIVQLTQLDARFILDTEEGVTLYHMKMTVTA